MVPGSTDCSNLLGDHRSSTAAGLEWARRWAHPHHHCQTPLATHRMKKCFWPRHGAFSRALFLCWTISHPSPPSQASMFTQIKIGVRVPITKVWSEDNIVSCLSAHSDEGSGRPRGKPVTHEAEGAQFSSSAFTLNRCIIPEPSGEAEMEKIQPWLSRP